MAPLRRSCAALPGSLRRAARKVKSTMPPVNFITLHYTYFIVTIMLSAIIFWAASTPSQSVSFMDSFFLVTSAMTLAGLNTINLSTINTFQQVSLFVLTMMGSAIFVSAFVVQFRRRAFERKFEASAELLAVRHQRQHSQDPASKTESRPISEKVGEDHVLRTSDRSHDALKRISVEYRAIYLLSWLVPLYFVLWQLLSCLGIGAYVAHNRASTALENGMNPFWVGAFNAVSAFNNNGMSLLDANMTAFQDAYYMLITMGLLILAGNTCYPIFLRLIIWTMHAATPDTGRWSEHKATLRYLLDHPRHCYTHLFPSRHTWWLLITVIILNMTDWIGFEILNIGNRALNSALSLRLRVIDGLFQALAVRSGGFYVVTIPSLRISVQVLYVIMMYISVYPVVMTMRDSNAYEDRSLGIYPNDPAWRQQNRDKEVKLQSIWRKVTGLHRQRSDDSNSRSNFVRQQFEGQLTDDIWWLVLAIFLIMIVEGSEFEQNPALFSVFNVIFETVSAYGTVGISVGVPYADYSFCGAWKTLSRLILCAVMLRGRHRGLPVAIDSAILLPHEAHTHCPQEEAMTSVNEQTPQKGEGAR